MADPASTFVSSDADLLNLLRGRQQMTVNEMADAMEVTATAVRQRLTRLLGQGLIQRNAERAGRGRPLHQYELTEAGRRKSGANFADLAIVLWEELRSVKEPSVRRGLLERISQRLAIDYSHEIPPGTLEEKMTAMVGLLSERNVPFEVSSDGELPVLTALACPYPGLADQDRSICSMERMMLSEMLGQDVNLNECRLDGAVCCTFEPRP